MRKIIGLLFAGLILVGGLSLNASAQTINQRQRNQQRRIYQGVRSGQLNRREAYRLQRQQYRTNRLEQRYRRSGGGLSWRERNRLKSRENRTSRSIYRQKHDRQRRRY